MVMMVELPVISQIQEVFSGECHEIFRHLTCFPVKVWFEKVIDAEPGGLCHKTPGPGDLSREQINRIDPAFPHGVSLKWPWHPKPGSRVTSPPPTKVHHHCQARLCVIHHACKLEWLAELLEPLELWKRCWGPILAREKLLFWGNLTEPPYGTIWMMGWK